MLGQISTAMAQAGLNIHNMVNKSRGDMAYTLVDVDSPVAEPVLRRPARHRRRAGGALPAGPALNRAPRDAASRTVARRATTVPRPGPVARAAPGCNHRRNSCPAAAAA